MALHQSYEVITGSPLYISKTVAVRPESGLGEQAWITVKENTTQTDAEALIKKSITTVGGANGQLVNNGNNTVTYTFKLVHNDTVKLIKKNYIFDIWIKLANEEPTGFQSGVLVITPAVTLSTS